VLHLLAWETRLLLSLVSYELGVLAFGVNIPVDGVGDGAGDAVLRSPKGFLNRFLSDFWESFVDIASRTLNGKNRCYRNGNVGEETSTVPFCALFEAECCSWLSWPPIAAVAAP
jgi:hypothetical protein